MFRVVPFLAVMMILALGLFAAADILNSPPEEPEPTVVRPTVTPRPRPTSPRQPTETPFVAPATVPAVPAPAAQTPASTPTVRGTPTPPGQDTLRVGNTDGQGVYIRRTPRLDDRIRPWRDGTPMVVLGPPQTANGLTWLRVRAPDGVEGYIPAQYLVP